MKRKRLVVSTQTIRLLTRAHEVQVRGGTGIIIPTRTCGSGSGVDTNGSDDCNSTACMMSDLCNG